MWIILKRIYQDWIEDKGEDWVSVYSKLSNGAHGNHWVNLVPLNWDEIDATDRENNLEELLFRKGDELGLEKIKGN